MNIISNMSKLQIISLVFAASNLIPSTFFIIASFFFIGISLTMVAFITIIWFPIFVLSIAVVLCVKNNCLNEYWKKICILNSVTLLIWSLYGIFNIVLLMIDGVVV